MIHKLSRYLMTLALLLTAVTGAWAETETITTASDLWQGAKTFTGTNVTVSVQAGGNLDGSYVNTTKTMDISVTGDNIITGLVLTIGLNPAKAGYMLAQPGTCTVSGSGSHSTFVTVTDINASSVTMKMDDYAVYVEKVEVTYANPYTPTPVANTTNQWKFLMPAGDVDLEVEYYPGKLSLCGDAIEGGTVEVVGMTDDALPAGFEKDAEGNIYVEPGTEFQVKAVPAEGYHLQSWADDDKVTDLVREITMPADGSDLSLTATFAQMPVLTLAQSDATMGIVTVEGAGGTASIGPKEEIKSNNNFVGEYYQVTGGGTNASWRKVGSSDNSTITIESLNGEIINNLTLEVYTAFVWGGYSIATTSGTVSGDPENNAYIYVTDINATSVTLSRTGTGSANGTVGFSMFTVNGIEDAAPAAPANIFPVEGEDGKYYFIPGSQITLKAVPEEGYHFVCWSDDETNTNPEREITMPADGSDLSLSATFAENEYNITFSEGTNPDPENPEWTATPNPAKTKQTVTVTYTGSKKVIGVKAEKKSSAPTLKDALADGATVVITYTWMGTNVTTFTYTNNGGEYTGSTTGADAEYFDNGMSMDGTTLKFTASNQDISEANVSIDFFTDTNEYSAVKGSSFTSFTISVNGTDVTSQLTEVVNEVVDETGD